MQTLRKYEDVVLSLDDRWYVVSWLDGETKNTGMWFSQETAELKFQTLVLDRRLKEVEDRLDQLVEWMNRE
jgi:hypothetical protein